MDNADMKDGTTFTPIVMLSLIIVYIVWGSTYLAIDLTLDTMPPLVMTGMRFLAAGIVLISVLMMRGHNLPKLGQWRNCATIGGAMLGGGVGGIAIAEQTISSGLASVGIATVPIWAVLLAGIFTQKWPNRLELTGIFFGFLGVILLNAQGGLNGASSGAVIIVIAALCWALGSVLSQHLDLPKGPMAYACEMLSGGAIVTIAGLVTGERFTRVPDVTGIWAWLYLVIGGSLLAYTAYMFLLRNVRTSVATSYTLVTPVVALILGYWIQSEQIDMYSILAICSVLCGVGFIFRGRTSPTGSLVCLATSFARK